MNNNQFHRSLNQLKCQRYETKNIEIIKCDQNVFKDEMFFNKETNKDLVSTPNIIKFKLTNQISYCNTCQKIHEKKDETNDDDITTNDLQSTRFQFDFKSLANNNFDIKIDENTNGFDDLNYILSQIDSFDKINMKDEFELMQNKIINKIGDLKQTLKDEKQRLINNLEIIKEVCLNSLNENSSNLKEYESFVFICNKKLDNLTKYDKLISKITEKQSEFNSYLLMDQNIRYISKPNEKIDKNSVGILFATESFNQINLFKNHLNQESDRLNEYPHLNQLISSKKLNQTISIINELDFKNQIHNFTCQLLTIHSVGLNGLILCNRYAKSISRNDLYCDLNLFDVDGRIVKKFELKNKLVRCIHSNKKYVLLTLETDDDVSENDFQLNLYDSKINLIKSIKIENDSPANCFIDDLNRIYLVKNKVPFIIVYDSALNVINKFGQDISSNYPFFINSPRSINNIFVKNDTLYVQSNNLIKQIDINNGSCLLTIKLEHIFTNFYVNSKNELIYICENNKLVVFDMLKSNIVKEMRLETSKQFNNDNQTTETNLNNLITSFSINNDGFLSVIFYKNSIIATY